MNKIEKFIIQNRELLDTEDAPESVWGKIQLPEGDKQIKRRPLLRPLYKWSIAAVCTGIIFISIYLFIQKPNHPAKNLEDTVSANIEQPQENSDDSLATENIKTIVPAHKSKVEEIYKSIVAKQDELKNVARSNPELYRQFASDLATLDSSYRVLQSQADLSPNRDVIIKAMIQNLQLQAELLSRQLSIIHQFKNSKNENHETNNKRNI